MLYTALFFYLVNGCEVSEEAFGAAEHGFAVGANHQVPNVPLGAVRVQQKLFPVRQTERREHHEVVLVAHQEGGDGQRLWRLICACGWEKE